MVSSISDLADNFAERIHKIKCKHELDNKKCKTCATKYKDCACSLEYTSFKNDVLEYKCLCCDRNYRKTFDENLKIC